MLKRKHNSDVNAKEQEAAKADAQLEDLKKRVNKLRNVKVEIDVITKGLRGFE